MPDVILSGAKNLFTMDETLRSAQGDNRSEKPKPALSLGAGLGISMSGKLVCPVPRACGNKQKTYNRDRKEAARELMTAHNLLKEGRT